MTIWIDFAEIRQKISLEDVLLRFYGLGDRLKRQGDKLVGPCPVHNGDGPRAFHADLKKNAWHCFSQCRKGGNQIDLVAAKEGLSTRDAALKLHAHFLGDAPSSPNAPSRAAVPAPQRVSPGAAVPAGAPDTAAPPPKTPREIPVNPPLSIRLQVQFDHPHLLKERGLALETLKQFGVGYVSQGTLRGTIGIPIKDEDGDLVAYAGRRLKWADIREHGRYKLPKGFRKDLVLYNLDRAKEHAEHGLILTEGFFSVLKLAELGVPNAVASMGCALSEAQADLLAEHTSLVTILYDGNDAGRGGAVAAKALLDARGVKSAIVYLPDDAEPEHLPIRLLRWALNGVRLLDLEEVRFTVRQPAK